MTDEPIRLQRYLSLTGITSRRKAEEMILAGRVSVNGKPVTELGTKVTPGRSRVMVDGKPVFWNPNRIYVLLNKPAGYITSLDDPEKRPVVTDLLPKRMPRIYPVGRLDWDSEGLLLMTNDGDLAHRLMHPSSKMEREYAVKVKGEVKDDSPVLEALKRGVRLEDGLIIPDRVAVQKYTGNHTWLSVTITSGRNRVVRRMFESVGHPVLKLRRLRIGELTLQGVAPGGMRDLTDNEVRALYEASGGSGRHVPPRRSRDDTKSAKRGSGSGARARKTH